MEIIVSICQPSRSTRTSSRSAYPGTVRSGRWRSMAEALDPRRDLEALDRVARVLYEIENDEACDHCYDSLAFSFEYEPKAERLIAAFPQLVPE